MDKPEPLSEEELAQTVHWALGSAAMIALLYHSSEATTPEEVQEKLEALDRAVEIMHDVMPECLHGHAHELAAETLEEAEETEKLVNEFKKQIDEL